MYVRIDRCGSTRVVVADCGNLLRFDATNTRISPDISAKQETTTKMRSRYCCAWTIALTAAGLFTAPAEAASQCGVEHQKPCGTIDIGRPKLWSLGDAQELVGQAREKLKALRVALPGETGGVGVIDPNEVNLRQLDVLFQSLGISAQYDQGDALKNRAAQQKYEHDLDAHRKK